MPGKLKTPSDVPKELPKAGKSASVKAATTVALEKELAERRKNQSTDSGN